MVRRSSDRYGSNRIRSVDQAPLYANERVCPHECEFCDNMIYGNVRDRKRDDDHKGHCNQCDRQVVWEPVDGFLGGFNIIGKSDSFDIEPRWFARAGAIFNDE